MKRSGERPFRFIDDHGEFNVVRRNIPRRLLSDIYHYLLVTRWRIFLSLILGYYIALNLAFAGLFMMQPGSVVGVRDGSWVDHFSFSVQTMSSIGYGVMSPKTDYAHMVVSIEALVGLISIAMMTGLMFAKFSRPTARVMFSRRAIIRDFDGERVFMFRMANLRQNQVVSAELDLQMVRTVVLENGESFRKLQEVPLKRSRSSMFVVSWTAIHVIDEDSPFYEFESKEQWEGGDVEVVVSFSGVDGTFNQMIHAKHSYIFEDLEIDEEFADVLSMDAGSLVIDYEPFHDMK